MVHPPTMNPPTKIIGPSQPRAAGSDAYESPLAVALRESVAARRVYVHDVSGILGKTDKIAVRAPTKGEQDAALIKARKYVRELVGDDKDAGEDADIMTDAKAAAIVQAAVRYAGDGAKPGVHPAFPSVEFVIRNLTPDQIAALLNLVNEARAQEPGGQRPITPDDVENIVEAVAKTPEPMTAHAVLATMSRESLSAALVLVCLKLDAARKVAAMAAAEETATPSAPSPGDRLT